MSEQFRRKLERLYPEYDLTDTYTLVLVCGFYWSDKCKGTKK